MKIEQRPLSDVFGTEVLNIHLSAPLEENILRELCSIWVDRQLLLFREQHLSPEQQVSFSRQLGELEGHPMPQFTLPGYPQIFVVSNIKENGRNIGAARGGRYWHSDYYYKARPASGSFLLAREVPSERGDTEFASMVAAYEALSETMRKRLEGLKCLHSRVKGYSRQYPERPPLTPEEAQKTPDVIHPLVRTHPETGRKALYLGMRETTEIVNMPEDESSALLEELREFATQPRFTYRHRWRVGDGLLWDNRSLMHRATPIEPEDRRLMHRTTIAGDSPS